MSTFDSTNVSFCFHLAMSSGSILYMMYARVNNIFLYITLYIHVYKIRLDYIYIYNNNKVVSI